MKKFIIVFLVLILSGCASTGTNEYQEKYYSMINLINERDEFKTNSSYFDISTDISRIEDGGYRYYVVVDKPRNAMKEISMIVIEKDVDYSKVMAANIGVLTSDDYNMIPNQYNPEKGYYQGVSASGVSSIANPTLYVLVQWKDGNSNSIREYFKLEINQ